MLPAGRLCLHTPRADCNEERRNAMKYLHLCLHTLRADCNGLSIVRMKLKCTFASTRSVQIATVKSIGNRLHTIFASTRSVQIATQPRWFAICNLILCLHTLRADCNWRALRKRKRYSPLPPHAPCRLQQAINFVASTMSSLPPHAPCRLQRQKCTELQYALFRTCVELVDSFSVLNKAMLR